MYSHIVEKLKLSFRTIYKIYGLIFYDGFSKYITIKRERIAICYCKSMI